MDGNNRSICDDAPMDIIQIQQGFYETFGYGLYLIYDNYPSKVFVEMKIDLLLPALDKTNKNRLIDTIWSQRIHRGNLQLYMSPIFVCVVYDSNVSGRLSYPLHITSKRFSIHPVFRIQKCNGNSTDANGQNNCCAIFVDEFGRVYRNWEHFSNTNKFDDGLVVAPKMGIYNGLPSTNHVLLDIFLRSSGVTKKLDTGSTAVGLVSAVVCGVALIPAVTVAPVVLTVATGAAVTSALYSGLRSGYKLFDRKRHKQSIGLKDKEARGAWINVGVGVVSASAAGASQAIARAAQNGRNVSNIARNSARAINIGAVTINVGACADESFSIICALLNREPISQQQIAQLCIYLFLFRHSAINFQTANQLMSSDLGQNESMKALLCVSQKESFKKLIGQTIRVCGAAVGNPIVRSLKQSLSDPRILMEMAQLILKGAEKAELSIEYVISSVCGKLVPSIAREYCKDFDRYLMKIIRSIEQKLNIRNLNSMLRPLINLLREMTFKACNKFLNFVEQLIIEIAQSFRSIMTSINVERFLKMMHLQLGYRSASEHTDLNNFMLSIKDDELQSIDSEVCGTFNEEKMESLEQIVPIYDDVYGSDCSLEDSRKLELLVGEYASEYTTKFEKCSPASNAHELNEVIVLILKRLPYEMATKFFAIAEELITDHALYIQRSLGRFISVDIFIVDIYSLLTNHSAAKNYESLDEYLFTYTSNLYGEVERVFKHHYIINHDASLKIVKCPTCRGEVFK